MVPIRRLFRVVNGGTPTADAENWGGDVPWATPVDLAKVDGRVLESTERTLTELGLRTGSRLVGAGALILSTRAPIGYVAETTSSTAFNQGCRGLEPIMPMDVRFFRYQLGAAADRLAALGQGSTFIELSGDALAAFPVIAPPLEEQRAIADYLDRETARIDALIAARQQMLRLLGERFGRRRDAVFDDLPGQMVKLGRFVRSIGQGSSPPAEDREVGPGEWGVLKLSAVKSGLFIPKEHKTLPPGTPPVPSLVPRTGDLLVTRANTPDLVGDACAVRHAADRLMLCDLIYVLRLAPDLDARFAAEALLTTGARAQISSVARGTSQSMVKLRGEDVKNIAIRVPALSTQLHLVVQLDTTRQQHSELEASLRQSAGLLGERRQALITAAISGDVSAQVPA